MIGVRGRFHLGCTFLDLFFDKITSCVGLFYVLGLVCFQRLDAVSGLLGNEPRACADRGQEAHVTVPRVKDGRGLIFLARRIGNHSRW
jgi:hypothetical protein